MLACWHFVNLGMQYFEESDLNFAFPEDWVVKKFDETRFFKHLSGVGFKGVDFIIITPEPQLILIEVKNYIDRWPTDNLNPTEILGNDLERFSKIIIKKFEDSFRLVGIIEKYYKRKWWYSWLAVPIAKFLSFSKLLKMEWGFWKIVNELLEKKEVELILWLELSDDITASEQNRIFQSIQNYIEGSILGFSFRLLHHRVDDKIRIFKK